MALIHSEEVNTRLHQRRRRAVGVRGGVGVDEAAGVRGHGGVQGQGDLRRQRPQLPADVADDLPAGGPGGVHALVCPEALKGGVVVDGQADAVEVGLRLRVEQPPGGHVHRHHEAGLVPLRGPQVPDVGQVVVRGLRVAEHPGGLPQPAQGQAQAGGAAGGVPVGAAVGQNEETVPLPQQGGGGLYGQLAHVSSSRMICSLAGLGGLTTSGSRSISRMWAPCWMESSARNWSSGV